MAQTDEERYGTFNAIPRNPYVGAASDAVGGLRTFLNQATIPKAVPLIGGQGVGQIITGDAPEELDRWAHGFSPFKDRSVPGYAGLRGVPDLQTKRTGPIADTLFLGADAAGVGAGLRALGKTGIKNAARGFDNLIDDTGRDASRRAFVKKAGIIGAGAAVAAATPRMLKTVAKAVAPDPTTVATRVAKNALGSVPEYYRAMRKASEFKLYKFYDELQKTDPKYTALKQKSDDAYARNKAAYDESNPNGQHYDDYVGESDGYDFPEYWEYSDYADILEGRAHDAANKEIADALKVLRKENPDYADLPRLNDIHYRAGADEFPPGFLERTGYLPTENDVYKHLKSGKEYIDPLTGNKARLVKGVEPHKIGHKGTRNDIEWESPSGVVQPYQHWLPEYVPDEEIGKYLPDGRTKDSPLSAAQYEALPF